jgi:OPA family glycerol-3-phosphate transporter-like MFS transporter
VQSLVYSGNEWLSFKGLLPSKEAAKDPANWRMWPIAMVPVTLVGLGLATRVWNAKPKAAAAVPVAPKPPGEAGEDPALAATVPAVEASGSERK